MTKAVATYLYCLVRSARRPALTGISAGLPGTGKPRLLDAGDGLWLVVGDAPLEKFSESALERGLKDLDWVSRCALAHERVIAKLLRAPALLPARLFTLFSTDERALADLKPRRRSVDKALAHVAGCVEWGVRVGLDVHAARKQAETRAHDKAGTASPGTGFLLRKRAVRDLTQDMHVRSRAAMTGLFDDLAGHAHDAVRRPILAAGGDGQPAARLLLDAAFLVPTRRAAGFQRQVAKLAKGLSGNGYQIDLTGPWPPYNFSR